MSGQRVLIVGSGGDDAIGTMFVRAAEQGGLPVELVDVRIDITRSLFDRVAFRLLNRRHRGETAFNQRVLSAAARFKPMVMLVTGLMPVRASVLEEVRHLGVATVNYMTGDPFNPTHRSPTALQSIPAFDLYMSLKPAADDDLRDCNEITACTVDRRVVRCARGVGHPAGKACSAGARAHGAIAPGVGGD